METLTRTECVRRIWDRLAELVEEEQEFDTVCDAAARETAFCRGFDRFPTHILRERFAWLAHDPELSREELLDRIRRWIHARRFVLGLQTACDVMQCEKDLCLGGSDFTDDKLEASFEELFGRSVRIEEQSV